MDSFNKDQNIQNILTAFKEIDEKREAFNKTFKVQVKKVVREFYPVHVDTKEMNQLYTDFATQLQNVTDSVVDKDDHYPAYRMDVEVQQVIELAEKTASEEFNQDLYQGLLKEFKSLMVASNEKVFDLSAEAFRLLDASAKVTLHYFIGTMRTIIKLSE